MGDITCDPSRVEQDREVAAEIRSFVLSHGGLDSARGVLRKYALNAQEYLKVLKPSQCRDGLMSIAAYVGGL
jgi:geranylgeranyl pyrophosphate synthase